MVTRIYDVLVIKREHDFECPKEWSKYDDNQLVNKEDKSVAPRCVEDNN